METSARRTLPLTVTLFFLSGVSGLVYQVIWVRQLGKVFGNTVHSAALVTGVFMCGLGAGSYVAGRWIDRRHAADPTLPLRMYGHAELGIAALGALLAVLLPRLGGLSAWMSSYERGPDGWYELSAGAYALRYAIAIVTLAPATLLMGATLTLLIRFLVARDLEAAGLRVGLLYGLNTAGSALGALLTDFALVPGIGILRTQLLAAALNAVAGLGALALARGVAQAEERTARAAAPAASATGGAEEKRDSQGGGEAGRKSAGSVPASAPPGPDPAAIRAGAAADPSGRRAVGLTAAALALSGIAAMGMEIVWFRYLTEILGALRAVLSMLLAVILAGIWLGSTAGGALQRRVRQPAALLIIAQGLFVALTLGLLGLFDHAQLFGAQVERAREALAAASPGDRALMELGMNLRAIAIVVLGPALLLGVSFPLANAHVQRAEEAVGGRAGALYLANTLGNVLGSALTGFVLLPGLGIQRTTAVLAAAAVAALLPLYLSAPRARATRAALAAGLAVAVAGLAGFLQLPRDRLLLPSIPRRDDSGARRLLSLTEGLDETIAVTEIPGFERRLWTNGHSMSSTHPKSRRYMSAFAHLPLLSMDRPERALVICFGVGTTLHAASLHPSIQALEIADLSRHVLEQAPLFAEANGGVLSDPRVSVFIDDGRHHLATQPEAAYDLITLEPPPIAFAGVSSLYSLEFYALARTRLRPGGHMTQWLPAYQVPADAVLAMVRAFVDVFPASVLLSGDDNELILMGANSASISIDPQAVARRLEERPRARADLAAIDLGTLTEIAGTFAASGATLAAATRAVPPLSDDRPTLEYSQRSGVRVTRLPPELFDVTGLDRWCPSCEASIPGLSAYLRVRGLLYASEAFLRSGTNLPGDLPPFFLPDDPALASAVASSRYLARLFGGEGLTALETGKIRLSEGDLPGALGALRRAVSLRPADPEAREALGLALDAAGELPAARAELEQAVALAPGRASARFALGATLRHLGELQGALDQFRVGLEVEPSDPEAHLDYGVLLQKSGQAEAAEDEFRASLEIDPRHPRSNLVLCKRAAAQGALAEATGFCDIAAEGGAEIPADLRARLKDPHAMDGER